MLATEKIRKIQKLFIKSRRQSTELFTGEYETAFRGRGMVFEEFREYVPGDEVRFIDWKVTARTGKTHIKVFREEREQVIFLMIDGSRSNFFGSKELLKKELIAELGGLLTFAATRTNDKVGLMIFTDKVEVFLPPKKGRSHAWMVISKILSYEPKSDKTDINLALKYLSQAFTRRSVCFLISDFIDEKDYLGTLKTFSFKHDLVCLHITDPLEANWPLGGIFSLKDLETGQMKMVSLKTRGDRERYRVHRLAELKKIESEVGKTRSDYLLLDTTQDYVRPLLKLFKQRECRQIKR